MSGEEQMTEKELIEQAIEVLMTIAEKSTYSERRIMRMDFDDTDSKRSEKQIQEH